MPDRKSLLLVSMPFADCSIPSIQLATLESFLRKKDVSVKSCNIYLKAAEFFGLDFYNFLINSPNDPHVAQLFFSKYVFPEYWNKNNDKIKMFFNDVMLSKNKDLKEIFSFNVYEEKTDVLLKWVVKNLSWSDFDFIGFSINYGQLLPSLSIAKTIKDINPNKKIIFGGSSCIKNLG